MSQPGDEIRLLSEVLQRSITDFRSSVEKSSIVKLLSSECAHPISQSLGPWNIPNEMPSGPGIYVFWIRLCTTIESFSDMWTNERVNCSPAVIKSRLALWSDTTEWTALYLGKSRHVADRVAEHVSLRSESSTYALKLQNRRCVANCPVSVSVVTLPATPDVSRILEIIESQVRTHICPIIGRQ